MSCLGQAKMSLLANLRGTMEAFLLARFAGRRGGGGSPSHQNAPPLLLRAQSVAFHCCCCHQTRFSAPSHVRRNARTNTHSRHSRKPRSKFFLPVPKRSTLETLCLQGLVQQCPTALSPQRLHRPYTYIIPPHQPRYPPPLRMVPPTNATLIIYTLFLRNPCSVSRLLGRLTAVSSVSMAVRSPELTAVNRFILVLGPSAYRALPAAVAATPVSSPSSQPAATLDELRPTPPPSLGWTAVADWGVAPATPPAVAVDRFFRGSCFDVVVVN